MYLVICIHSIDASTHSLNVKTRLMNILICFYFQIENLQEQLRDKDKQLTNLKDRVKSLQTDSSNTDTALATLEEALSEKVMFSHEIAFCATIKGEVCPENVFLSWCGPVNRSHTNLKMGLVSKASALVGWARSDSQLMN